ncbi:MAG: rhomboid family intramembrane serine protease [Proteobacteria bacterium]|nr:rhomboid family intramembrane serine protease [Pseudomonadota bacterium]
MVACVLVFVWQYFLAGPTGVQRIAYALGLIPAVLFGGEQLPTDLVWVPPAATLLTSMFLHGGFLHLAGNMLFLWVFGNNIEDSMGHARFVLFYLVCGIAAALVQAFLDPASVLPMVGASGAISGVLGAYMLLYPRARVLLGLPIGFFIVQLGRFPAVWVLALWFLLQLVMGVFSANAVTTAGEAKGGVAWGAHIGGFIAGMVLIPFFKYRSVPLWRAGR